MAFSKELPPPYTSSTPYTSSFGIVVDVEAGKREKYLQNRARVRLAHRKLFTTYFGGLIILLFFLSLYHITCCILAGVLQSDRKLITNFLAIVHYSYTITFISLFGFVYSSIVLESLTFESVTIGHFLPPAIIWIATVAGPWIGAVVITNRGNLISITRCCFATG